MAKRSSRGRRRTISRRTLDAETSNLQHIVEKYRTNRTLGELAKEAQSQVKHFKAARLAVAQPKRDAFAAIYDLYIAACACKGGIEELKARCRYKNIPLTRATHPSLMATKLAFSGDDKAASYISRGIRGAVLRKIAPRDLGEALEFGGIAALVAFFVESQANPPTTPPTTPASSNAKNKTGPGRKTSDLTPAMPTTSPSSVKDGRSPKAPPPRHVEVRLLQTIEEKLHRRLKQGDTIKFSARAESRNEIVIKTFKIENRS